MPGNSDTIFEKDLPKLIERLQLLAPNLLAMILSSHSEGFDSDSLAKLITGSTDSITDRCVEKLPLQLACSQGRSLLSGHCVRWLADE